MTRQIFVNLATQDLKAARHFFEGLGFQINEQFSNDDGCCVKVADNISVMVLTESQFKNFTHKSICDTTSHAESLLCISCDSREEIDEIVAKARSFGAAVPREPQDHGFMYGHGFEDLDGHTWELLFMDAAAAS